MGPSRDSVNKKIHFYDRHSFRWDWEDYYTPQRYKGYDWVLDIFFNQSYHVVWIFNPDNGSSRTLPLFRTVAHNEAWDVKMPVNQKPYIGWQKFPIWPLWPYKHDSGCKIFGAVDMILMALWQAWKGKVPLRSKPKLEIFAKFPFRTWPFSLFISSWISQIKKHVKSIH